MVEQLPDLPHPLAYASGAVLGDLALVIGGTRKPDATVAENLLLALDLRDPALGWRVISQLPAPGRIMPSVGVRDGRFFVFSGASLAADAEGKPARTYLTDAWSFRPDEGWRRLADLPRAAVAAPSPAIPVGTSHLLVVAGDDGSKVGFQPRSAHPGFGTRSLRYHTVTDTWCEADDLGAAKPVAVAPVARWKGAFVIPGGELRPGVRTAQVVALRPSPERDRMGWIDWTVLVVYLGAMVGIGWWFMRKEAAATTEAYFRGDQGVPVWVAGLSIFATMLSSLTFMGIPARAYQTDISWYAGQLPLLVVVPLVSLFYLPFFRKLDLTSAYEYLERRFGLRCRLFASASFMLLHLGRIAIVLYLPALALASVTDIGVGVSIAVIGVLCVIYTLMGGIQAVVWTDAVQAIVLMGGALLCLVLAIARCDGGLPGMLEVALADDKLLGSLTFADLDISDATTSFWVIFVAFGFNTLISYTSSQDVVQRYVTTKDLAAARRSLNVNLGMSLAGSLLFFLLGTAIYAFYKTHPGDLDPAMAAPDAILPFFILRELPTGISGLVIAAIFAASQSTVSSSLNSLATCYVKDLDARVLRPMREDADYLRSAQWVVLVAGLLSVGVALYMAASGIDSAFKTFNTLIGLAAGSLGGLFALGVFTRRASPRGALVGALVGFATVIGLHLSDAPVTGILYGAVGFLTCMIVGYLASFALPGGGDRRLSIRGRS
jgi:SSS family transporter